MTFPLGLPLLLAQADALPEGEQTAGGRSLDLPSQVSGHLLDNYVRPAEAVARGISGGAYSLTEASVAGPFNTRRRASTPLRDARRFGGKRGSYNKPRVWSQEAVDSQVRRATDRAAQGLNPTQIRRLQRHVKEHLSQEQVTKMFEAMGYEGDTELNPGKLFTDEQITFLAADMTAAEREKTANLIRPFMDLAFELMGLHFYMKGAPAGTSIPREDGFILPETDTVSIGNDARRPISGKYATPQNGYEISYYKNSSWDLDIRLGQNDQGHAALAGMRICFNTGLVKYGVAEWSNLITLGGIVAVTGPDGIETNPTDMLDQNRTYMKGIRNPPKTLWKFPNTCAKNDFTRRELRDYINDSNFTTLAQMEGGIEGKGTMRRSITQNTEGAVWLLENILRVFPETEIYKDYGLPVGTVPRDLVELAFFASVLANPKISTYYTIIDPFFNPNIEKHDGSRRQEGYNGSLLLAFLDKFKKEDIIKWAKVLGNDSVESILSKGLLLPAFNLEMDFRGNLPIRFNYAQEKVNDKGEKEIDLQIKGALRIDDEARPNIKVDYMRYKINTKGELVMEVKGSAASATKGKKLRLDRNEMDIIFGEYGIQAPASFELNRKKQANYLEVSEVDFSVEFKMGKNGLELSTNNFSLGLKGLKAGQIKAETANMDLELTKTNIGELRLVQEGKKKFVQIESAKKAGETPPLAERAVITQKNLDSKDQNIVHTFSGFSFDAVSLVPTEKTFEGTPFKGNGFSIRDIEASNYKLEVGDNSISTKDPVEISKMEGFVSYDQEAMELSVPKLVLSGSGDLSRKGEKDGQKTTFKTDVSGVLTDLIAQVYPLTSPDGTTKTKKKFDVKYKVAGEVTMNDSGYGKYIFDTEGKTIDGKFESYTITQTDAAGKVTELENDYLVEASAPLFAPKHEGYYLKTTPGESAMRDAKVSATSEGLHARGDLKLRLKESPVFKAGDKTISLPGGTKVKLEEVTEISLDGAGEFFVGQDPSGVKVVQLTPDDPQKGFLIGAKAHVATSIKVKGINVKVELVGRLGIKASDLSLFLDEKTGDITFKQLAAEDFSLQFLEGSSITAGQLVALLGLGQSASLDKAEKARPKLEKALAWLKEKKDVSIEVDKICKDTSVEDCDVVAIKSVNIEALPDKNKKGKIVYQADLEGALIWLLGSNNHIATILPALTFKFDEDLEIVKGSERAPKGHMKTDYRISAGAHEAVKVWR